MDYSLKSKQQQDRQDRFCIFLVVLEVHQLVFYILDLIEVPRIECREDFFLHHQTCSFQFLVLDLLRFWKPCIQLVLKIRIPKTATIMLVTFRWWQDVSDRIMQRIFAECWCQVCHQHVKLVNYKSYSLRLIQSPNQCKLTHFSYCLLDIIFN